MNPCICNGCGGESPAWDKLCENCSKEVICQNCHKTYKRGQGLQEVDLCAKCLQTAFEDVEIPEELPYGPYTNMVDSFVEYGFDHHWEAY
jgi:hypothetical protein